MVVKTSDFKKLLVWQRAMELAERVYELIRTFPTEERYAWSDQIRRAVISIPSNIAEGQGRDSKQEFLRFISIARGSLCELETQLLLAQKIGYVSEDNISQFLSQCAEISRMLRSLSNYISSGLHNPTTSQL